MANISIINFVLNPLMLIVVMFFTVEWVNHSKEFQKGQGFTNAISLLLCFVFFIEWPEYRNWIRLGAVAIPLLLNFLDIKYIPKEKKKLKELNTMETFLLFFLVVLVGLLLAFS